MKAPLMKIRGPRINPRRIASLNPQSSPPASRTVVKPASRVASIASLILSASTAGGRAASAAASRSIRARCTWASSRPGISVRPWQSMTRASFGPPGPLVAPMRWIRPSSTITRASRCGSRPVQSRTVACSKTAFTARLVYLRGGVGQKEIGRKGEQESEEESPGQGGGGIEPAADVEHLVDDVDQGAGRQRQEEHIDIGGGKDVADDGAEEGRRAADHSGGQEKAPGRHGAVGRQGRRDAEALGDVVERKADHEHEREGDGSTGCRLADRQPFREVMQAEPGRDHHRQRPGSGGWRVLGSTEKTAIEIHEAEEAEAKPHREDRDERGEAAIAMVRGGQRGLDGVDGMGEDVPEQEDEHAGGDRVQEALDSAGEAPNPPDW